RGAWASGRVDLALATFSDRVKSAGDGRDGVIWRLEEATALRAAGRFEESSRAFEQAEARMAEYANRARVRVGNETMAAVTTPANLPYEGRSYDRIMAATYRALNALALGRPADARPALFKAYQYQQDAVAENARRIERAQQEASGSSHSDTVKRTQSNPSFQRQVDSLYKPVAQLQPYAEYVNPFTVWLDGIYFLHQAQDGSDLERARKSLERALAFAPANAYVRADLEAADRRLRGGAPEPVTYVVFESGLSAIRQQVRIDIPIIFANVSYIGSAWPVLQVRGGNALTVAAIAGNNRVDTARVASLDSVIARDFEDEKPAIVTRTIVSTLAKGTAAFVANQAASQQDEGLGALVRIATLAYQASVNIADTRSWTTLPKEFQIARLPTPADRRLQIVEGNQPPVTVALEDGVAHIVYVRSVGGNRPLQVIQSRLK
ncbi:MAG: hypothetical protein JNL97_00765, partial [Verrucomicrobiales bacterium]|nr:hypothetical protein [Verrucomicrobiales bacterium]